MKIFLKNTAKIAVGGKKYSFEGKMLNSVFKKLQAGQSYFEFLSVGYSTASAPETEFRLGNFLAAVPLSKKDFDFNPYSAEIYSKKIAIISNSTLDGKNIREIGITTSLENDGEIYAYFSLICDEFPNGIIKKKGEAIEIEITIELAITFAGKKVLTLGENDFVKFLLGEGNFDNIFAVRGNLFLKDEPIVRETPFYTKKYPTKVNFDFDTDGAMQISFEFDLDTGETREIVLLNGDRVFARLNVSEFHEPISLTETFAVKGNYCIDLNKDVLEVSSVINNSSNKEERDCYVKNYAVGFADKISLPFSDFITNLTPRFLSIDGDKIFFALNDNFFGYTCSKGRVVQLEIKDNLVQNIIKIVSFDKFIFVLSKSQPYVTFYIKVGDVFERAENDFLEKYSNLSVISTCKSADFAFFSNGLMALGFIDESRFAQVLYFYYDSALRQFKFDCAFTNSEYSFDFMLAMSYTNFGDGRLMFLKGGNLSSDCRIVTFFPDKSNTSIYSIVAYYFTHETKQIQVKGRAVVVEKTSTPHIFVYYYPQVYRFSLDAFEEEVDDFFSVDMLYLAQKLPDSTFKFFNLISYDVASPFENSLGDFVSEETIDSIEFLNDCLLVFLKDGTGTLGISLKNDSVFIENVSSNTDSYNISYKKASLLGANNEGVKVTFFATIKL